MTRTNTLAPGVEEWTCDECGRRLLLRRPPQFEKIVLEPGDEWAAHVGGTGSLQPTTMSTRGELRPGDRTWLSEHGIDWGPDAP